jgi:hypothetical protein
VSDDWTDDVVVDGVVGEFHAQGTGANIQHLERENENLRARVAALEEVVGAARPFADLPTLGASDEGYRLRDALANCDGSGHVKREE